MCCRLSNRICFKKRKSLLSIMMRLVIWKEKCVSCLCFLDVAVWIWDLREVLLLIESPFLRTVVI